MSLSCIFTAYAYERKLRVYVGPNGSTIRFECEVSTDAPANYVEHIEYATESYDDTLGEVISAYEDIASGKSRLASYYNYENAPAHLFSKWAHGVIDYIPNVPYDVWQDSQTVSYDNRGTRSSEIEALIDSRDNAILSTFNIDLTGYKEINPPEEEYFAEGLLTARRQIDLKYGDTIPVTYINSDKDHAYTFKQDITGINYMYEFNRNNDDWVLVASSETQGTIMEDGRKNRDANFTASEHAME